MSKNLLYRISLGWKLTLAFVLVALIGLAVGLIGDRALQGVERDMKDLGKVRLPSSEAILWIVEGTHMAAYTEQGLVNPNITGQARENMYKTANESIRHVQEGIDAYTILPKTAESERIWVDYQATYKEWLKKHDLLIRLSRERERLIDGSADQRQQAETNQQEMVKVMNTIATEDFEKIDTQMDGLATANNKAAEATLQASSRRAEGASTFQLITSTVSALIALLLGLILARWLGMELRRTAAEIREGAESATGASAVLTSTSLGIAEKAQHQAELLAQANTFVSELDEQAAANATDALHADQLTHNAHESAGHAKQSTEKLRTAMSDIQRSSTKAENIVGDIRSIASQTNLLALNASVEAARAGEQGAGFAVVAEEVRQLAGRATESAEQTEAIIKESIDSAHAGVDSTEEMSSALEGIANELDQVAALVTRISSAAGVQSTQIADLGGTINDLEIAADDEAAATEELAAAGEELSAQAAQLRTMVALLSVVTDGTSDPALLSQVHTVRFSELFNRDETRSAIGRSGAFLPANGVSTGQALPSEFKPASRSVGATAMDDF